jgi:hypothetical protein
MPPMAHCSNPSEDLTTMWCDKRRFTKLHFPSQHLQLNNTATSPPTAIKFLLKRESRKVKTSTTMANHDPRMNRTDPKYHALGIVGTWGTPCDSWNCLLISLCVLGIVCSCFVCFLSVCYCLVLMLVLVCVCVFFFGISASKPVWQIKPRIRNLSRVCFPCTYLWHLE